MPMHRVTLLAALILTFASAPALGQGTTLTILHVSDTHSHLDMTGPKDANLNGTMGGIGKAATIIGMTKMSEPNVLTLHGGDAFHGDFFFNAYFGVPELQIMEQLGFDAMTVGNHEFDLGPDVLAYVLMTAYGASGIPLLSANLDLSAVPELGLETWIRPSVIKDVGGISVGIFGMTVPGVPTTNNGAVGILGGDDPTILFGIAYQNMLALRSAGAQVVIFLSHLGHLYDEAIAAYVPGIDVILGAHDHFEYTEPQVIPNSYGGQTLIVQSGKHYEKVGKLRLEVGPSGVSLLDWRLIPLDAFVPVLPEVAAIVDQLKAGIIAKYGDVYYTKVAYALTDIKTSFHPAFNARDTGMGNLITDALRAKTKTNIAITANGLISEGIVKGWIVGADLFRPVSYGYDPETGLGLKIATFKISGAELIKGLEIGLAYYGILEDYFLQVSGMTFKFDSRLPPGQRVILSSVRINGKPLDPAKLYTCTVNEGLALLLPMMGIQVSELTIRPELEYNVLKEYARKLKFLLYTSQGRIRDVGAVTTRTLETDEDQMPPPSELTSGCAVGGTAGSTILGLAFAAVLFLASMQRRRS